MAIQLGTLVLVTDHRPTRALGIVSFYDGVICVIDLIWPANLPKLQLVMSMAESVRSLWPITNGLERKDISDKILPVFFELIDRVYCQHLANECMTKMAKSIGNAISGL